MLVILGVRPAVKCPCALAEFTVDIARLIHRLVLAHYKDVCLQHFFAEGRGHAHKSFDGGGVVLTQHSRHRIELGGEGEQRKIVALHWHASLPERRVVDGGEFHLTWIRIELKFFERKRLCKVKRCLRGSRRRIAVKGHIHYVVIASGQRD